MAYRKTAMAQLPQITERFKRALNMPITYSDNGGSYQIRLPGFKYDDFDRAGFVSIVKVLRAFEYGRDVRAGQVRSRSTGILMVFGRHTELHEGLQSRAALDFPMVLSVNISQVGKSSMDSSRLLLAADNGELLASDIIRVVNVDPMTGASIPLPEETRAIYIADMPQDRTTAMKFPGLQVPFSVPELSYGCKIMVQFDDMDNLYHTTGPAYGRLAQECAARATIEGFYAYFQGDIALYSVKSVTSVNMRQSFAGDELDVISWQDANNPLVLYFVIRKQGNDVYSARMEYNAAPSGLLNSKL